LRALAAVGVSRRAAATPIHMLLWTMGFEVKPPLFNSFIANVIFTGISFGAIFTSVMLVIDQITDLDRTAGGFASQCAFTTVLFALIWAALIERRVRKLDLPGWSKLDAADRFD
jgi:hypothetical protein